MQKNHNSDRTYQNRRNSAFKAFFKLLKSEKLRFLSHDFILFFCCYCLILIKLFKGSSSKINRTCLINVNSGENRKNSDSLMFLRNSGNRSRTATRFQRTLQ